MNDALEHIINRNDTWRGRHRRFHHHEPSANSDSHSCNTGAGLNTGYSSLDAQLDQGGWPLDSTIELLSDDTQQVLLVHPKNRQDLLWSTEQALRSSTCSAVFSWLGTHNYRYSELRKLQLAAANGDSLAVMFRPTGAADNHAPASLRLQMREYRKVHILKQRGGNQHIDVELPQAEDVPGQPQLWELPTWPGGRQGQAVPA